MNQALYAHMNNKRKMKKKKRVLDYIAIAIKIQCSQMWGYGAKISF
jgi:predicted membrane channel-forming protein YqfA (hemolysin III family)